MRLISLASLAAGCSASPEPTPSDNTVRNGVYVLHYDDGTLHARGEYRDGIKVGLWTLWYPDGKKALEEFFENGVRKRVSVWDQNGDCIFDEPFDGDEISPFR